MFAVLHVHIALILIIFGSNTDATKCKPYSTFKVDCDECQCSSDGTQYSCTVKKCRNNPFNENDLELIRSKIKPLVYEPYLNDAIPPENLDGIHNEFEEDDLYDDNANSKEAGQFQDVSLEEQDASVIDVAHPYDHRRSSKPIGLIAY